MMVGIQGGAYSWTGQTTHNTAPFCASAIPTPGQCSYWIPRGSSMQISSFSTPKHIHEKQQNAFLNAFKIRQTLVHTFRQTNKNLAEIVDSSALNSTQVQWSLFTNFCLQLNNCSFFLQFSLKRRNRTTFKVVHATNSHDGHFLTKNFLMTGNP